MLDFVANFFKEMVCSTKQAYFSLLLKKLEMGKNFTVFKT